MVSEREGCGDDGVHTKTACYDRQYKAGGWSAQISDGGAERGGGRWGGGGGGGWKVIINFLSSSCILYIFLNRQTETDRRTETERQRQEKEEKNKKRDTQR